jgi:hypothetical protein
MATTKTTKAKSLVLRAAKVGDILLSQNRRNINVAHLKGVHALAKDAVNQNWKEERLIAFLKNNALAMAELIPGYKETNLKTIEQL